jgi:SAM-dependent methyltransferase
MTTTSGPRPSGPVPLCPPPGIDPAAPSAARIHDWLLGGTDSHDADRQAGLALLRAAPEARQAARANRAFQVRAVRWLARQGITQFIDIGSGLPAVRPAHQAARQVHPHARVAYADNDPAAVTHARALLDGIPGVTAMHADLRQPRDLLTRTELRQVIDLARPAAVLLTGVLHLIPDTDDPAALIQAITERLAPGSYLAVSHPTADDATSRYAAGWMAAAREADALTAITGVPAPARPRSRAEVTRLLAGLDLIPPGVTDVRAWQRPRARPVPPVLAWAAAARVPGPPGYPGLPA